MTGAPYYKYLDWTWKSDETLFKRLTDKKRKTGFYRNPFPAAMAYATTIRMLGFAEPVRKGEIKMPFKTYGYVFRRNGKTIVPMWHADKNIDAVYLEVVFPSAFKKIDITGREEKIPAGKTKLSLRSAPCFLVFSDAPEVIGQAVRNGRFIDMEEVKGAMRPGPGDTRLICLANKTNRTVSSSVGNLKFELKPAAVVCKTISGKQSASVRASGKSINLPSNMSELKIAGAPEKIVIDGNIEEYKKIKPIKLLSPRDIYPRSASIPERALILNDGKDIEVDLYMAWDVQNLYVAAKVRERKHINSFLAEDLWRGDSLQLGIVPYNQAWPSALGKIKKPPFNISLAFSRGKTAIFDHVKRNAPEWNCVVKPHRGYTTYELAVPWSAIGMDKVRPGDVIALNAVFFALDDGTKTVQHWAAVSEGFAGGMDLFKFKTFRLE